MNIKRFAAFAMIAALMVAAMGLFGCGQAPVEEKLMTIGSSDNAFKTVKMTNETGKEITGVAIAQASTDFEGKDNLLGDQKWADGAKASVCCPKASEDTSSTGAAIRTVFNVQLTFGDDSKVVLHNLTFEEATEYSVKIDAESELGYVVYKADGKEASTLDGEKEVKQAEIEAAEAAAAAEQAAAEAAAAQAAADAAAAQAASQSYSYSAPSNPAPSAGGSASQSQDGCLGDVVLRR